MKIVHLSDEHWSSEPDKLEKAKVSARFINEWVEENRPALVVISGDLQDRRQWLTGTGAVMPMVEHVRMLSDVSPVLIIYGNEEHDPKGSLDFLRYIAFHHEVAVSDRPETYGLDERGLSCLIHVDGVKDSLYPKRPYKLIIHTLPYPTKEWLAGEAQGSIDQLNEVARAAVRDIMLGFGAFRAEHISKDVPLPSILVAHCNVAGSSLSNGQTLISQDLILDIDDLRQSAVDYIALGHIHKRQEFGSSASYAGSMYHLNFGEPEEKSFDVIEFDELNGKTVTAIPLPARRMVLRKGRWESGEFVLEDGEDFTGAETRVRVMCKREESESVDLELVKGLFHLAFSVRIEKIIEPDERTRHVDIQAQKTLRDKVGSWSKSIRGTVPTEEVLGKADEIAKEIGQ